MLKSKLNRREQLISLLPENANLVVEVGVFRGDFSEQLRNALNLRAFLQLVDPWCNIECPGEMIGGEEDYQHVKDRFKDDSNIQIHRKTSEEALADFFNDSVGLVYLDANHEYMHVKHDLHHWWKKLQKDGILAGHDIFTVNHFGVTQAVLEFAALHDVCVYLIEGDVEDGQYINAPSYYMRKP